MHVVELRFECFDNTTINAAEKAINGLLEAYRANGQILGREFAVAFNDGEFRARLLMPEKSSLAKRFNSPWVEQALTELTDAKLLAPREKYIGQDINSEVSSQDTPSWQLLYTSYVHMCSPLRNGDTLQPIPLYQLPATANGDHKRLIRWQTEWQACDEIQMAAGTKAEFGWAIAGAVYLAVPFALITTGSFTDKPSSNQSNGFDNKPTTPVGMNQSVTSTCNLASPPKSSL